MEIKWPQQVSLYMDLVLPAEVKPATGQWKLYKMGEINGAYKHSRYDRLAEKSAWNFQR